MEHFFALPPVLQGLGATLFTWFVTAAGASLVFFCKKVSARLLDLMMGFAAGVMIAASFWSLLDPAIRLAEELGRNAALTAGAGFLTGGLFIFGTDRLLSGAGDRAFRRSLLLTGAVTLHNIPEGLAVGVAFGSAAMGVPGASGMAAVLLAFGIGLQNFPEGVCVAMPLRREGMSRSRAFLVGQASGAVEVPAALLGVAFALSMRAVLPLALSFSAGAMLAVVCSELIPEAFRDNKGPAALGVLFGFVVMMVLDVSLG